MVAHPKLWKWSSYRSTAGYRKPQKNLTTDWILGYFGDDIKKAQNAYRSFVLAGIEKDSPLKDAVEGNIVGFPQFVDFVWSQHPNTTTLGEVPRNERMVGRPKLESLFDDLRDKQYRNTMICAAHFACGYTQKEIADHLNMHYSTVSKIVRNSRFKT